MFYDNCFLLVGCFVVVWHKTGFWFLLFLTHGYALQNYHSYFKFCLGRNGGFLDSGVTTDSGMLLVLFACTGRLLGDITFFN